MQGLLAVSRIIDATSAAVGRLAEYLVLMCCLVSAGVASVRYLFSYSSNGWLEIQWYMFAAIVLLGASHTLRMNEHVRVDLVYGNVSDRARLWIDTIGLVLFLIPPCLFLMWLCQRSHPLACQADPCRWVCPVICTGNFRTDQTRRLADGIYCDRHEVREATAINVRWTNRGSTTSV